MKRFVIVLLLSAGLVVFVRVSSMVPHSASAWDDDGGDSDDDGDDGQSGT